MSGSLAYGEQSPTLGETAVSWQTWSDGAAGIPNVTGDADWGKLSLQLSGAEGRSAVKDLGSAATRKFTLTENRYGTGDEDAVLQIRGDTSTFNQDDATPVWETYVAPISRGWRYVQVRETTDVGDLGTVYYVDATDGDDDATGLTEALAWQTITKVNESSFNPGDFILFKKGETFTGPLIPPSSGTDGAWIIFGAYGTGDNPIIDGTALYALDIELATGRCYNRFEHITFDKSKNEANRQTARARGHDLYFYDCEFSNSALEFGFSASSTDGSEIYNITLHTCRFHHNQRSGCYIGSTNAPGPHGILVTHCEAYDNGLGGAGWGNGIYVKYGSTVEYCYCHDNIVEGGIKTNCELSPATIYFPIVRYNYLVNNHVGLYCGCNGSLFYNNLVVDTLHYGLLNDGGPNSEFYFNTFIQSEADSAIRIADNLPSDGNIIKNNIFIQDSALPHTSYYFNCDVLDDAAALNTIDYNIYYHDSTSTAHTYYGTTGSVALDQTEWKALTGSPDAHSTYLTAVPDFVARYTDFHPADIGNLKGLGIAIAGYELDYDGNTRADPPTPGCFDAASA